MTVLDVGANLGYYTLLFSTLVGSRGRVVAFEPCPQNFSLLSRSLKANGMANVTVLQKAVAASPGELPLLLSPRVFGGHRIGMDRTGDDADASEETITVSSVTVDDVVEHYGLRPDFVKMDIEGAECFALQGMERTLAANDDILIMCELSPGALHKCGSTPEDLLRILRELGFRFFEILSRGRVEQVPEEKLVAAAVDCGHINILASR